MKIENTIITGVVAHVDHGKTTLIDSLIATQGRISKSLAGDLRYMDTRVDEQDRGITLKLSAIRLINKETEHIIIDTPGHSDFEFLVENNSVLSDCFLILIDAMEGITPRTFSLINYIDQHSSVLVINKIDKITEEVEAYSVIEDIIKLTNAMIGEDVFSWENNNVILSCATMCYGINFKYSNNLLGSERCSLRATIKFIYLLESKIRNNDVEKICLKYKIKSKNQKNIMMAILPLGEVVFNPIESVYSAKNILKHILALKTPLRINGDIEKDDTIFFVSLALLKEQKNYTKDNLLFMSRLFKGTVSVGDKFYNRNEQIVVEELYLFDIGNYLQVEKVSGSKLFCIKGNLKKNTLLCSNNNLSFSYVEKLTPFCKTKLILDDNDRLDDLRSLLKVLINTEQCLRLKINKYNEVEVLASGKVQSEKLLEDIKSCGLIVHTAESDLVFCEYATENAEHEFNTSQYQIYISINRKDNSSLSDDTLSGNLYGIDAPEGLIGTVESSLNIFVKCGPLIRESIRETLFNVKVVEKDTAVGDEDLFGILMKSLKTVYLLTKPIIAPFFYQTDISIQKDYLGQVYNGIQKFKYIMSTEEYDSHTAFYTISIYITHFNYEKFIEEISVRSKGTAYIKTTEFGYLFKLDFSEYIDIIKKNKGLLTSEKIIENPEKQRTLKR